MKSIKGIYHVTYTSDRYEELLSFYQDALGFDEVLMLRAGDMRKMFGLEEECGWRGNRVLCYVRVAPREYLELTRSVKAPEFSDTALREYDDDNYVCTTFGAADMDELCKRLNAKHIGYEVLAEKIGFNIQMLPQSFLGNASVWVKDPANNILRFIRHEPESSVQRARNIHTLLGISLLVNKIEPAKCFYSKLGFAQKEVDILPDYTLLSNGRQFIELIASDKPVVRRKDGHVAHFAMESLDSRASEREFDEEMLTVIDTPFTANILPKGRHSALKAADGCVVSWVLGPDQTAIEIMEQPDDARQSIFEAGNIY